ncbi:Toxin RelE1 [Caulobacter sp. NIBR1757]|nr:Toxin RelE1 [Caulobacter sp. NIBR1757]
MEAIIASARSLSQFPGRGYGGVGGQRQLRVPFGKRGYVIRYLVLQTEVRIVRIFHGLEDR